MGKWIHNTSGSAKTYLGYDIADTAYFEIPITRYREFADSESVLASVQAGDIVLSWDGVTDLDATDSEKFLTGTTVAELLPFNNDTNSFTSKDVQAAIEEARNSAIGALVPFNFVAAGNNVANKWLGFNKNVPGSDVVPWTTPQDIDIKGVVFANENDNSDTDIKIYVNGSLISTIQVRDRRVYWDVGASKGTANQGDRISVYLFQVGSTSDAPSDPLVTLYCKFTAEVPGTGGLSSGV